MAAILLVPPSSEPASLADMKTYLRVDHDEEDALIAGLIAAARADCEVRTGRALVNQTWRAIRDRWPADGRIRAPRAPVVSVAAARVLAADGTPTAIETARFAIAAGAVPGMVLADGVLPAPGRAVAGIEIDLVCGHGAGPDSVPPALREAVRRLVAHLYDRRGLDGETPSPMPAEIDRLLAPFRMVSL